MRIITSRQYVLCHNKNDNVEDEYDGDDDGEWIGQYFGWFVALIQFIRNIKWEGVGKMERENKWREEERKRYVYFAMVHEGVYYGLHIIQCVGDEICHSSINLLKYMYEQIFTCTLGTWITYIFFVWISDERCPRVPSGGNSLSKF